MQPPATIAHYKIASKLGEGGMGAVYRATDTKLNREVAVKVLPDSFAADADRLARFTREAQVLASLNHPNIAVIYSVEDRALVMELVPGTMLAGPLPVETALDYALQIAEALEAAHEKGIIHRDLKPANIMVTPAGRVKVLDFGLAKAVEESSGNPEISPTLTISPTRAGIILGTAAYMAPEQARGKPVDKRADIWAFGCVLYEMLTGKQAFAGETVSDILAGVLAREADLSGLPEHLRPIVAKCLRKDPRLRWRDIADVRMALQDAAPSPPAPAMARRPWSIIGAATLAIGLGLGWLAAHLWQRPAPDDRALNFSIPTPPGESVVLGAGGGSAISPDGRVVAFVATSGGIPKQWTRRLDAAAAHELPGTDGAQSPFWSPDSRSLGFVAASKLKRVDLAGGPPIELAEASAGRGGAWSSTGAIIYCAQTVGGLYRVSAAGGAATPLTTLDQARNEGTHRYPQFLPDGRRFIFFVRGAQPHASGIYLGSLDRPQDRTMLVETSTAGAYCTGRRGGYLLWLRGNSLVAQPFDAEHGRLSGEPQAVPGAESVSLNTGFGIGGFSAAENGTVLFAAGADRYQLAWFSRDGKVLSTVGKPDHYGALRASPDGSRAGIEIEDSSGNRDLWLLEFAREVQSRLTTGRNVLMAFWTTDGRRLVYFNVSGYSIFAKNASGGGAEEELVKSRSVVYASDFSPDGRFLIYEEFTGKGSDLWLIPTAGERKPVPYLTGPGTKMNAQFSPDGKWVAYVSDESGRQELYVQGFPLTEAKWQVSNAGGNHPRWRRDGKELFYVAPDGMLMVVSVAAKPQGLEFGTPIRLLRTVTAVGPHPYTYDISPDGQKILSMTPGRGAADTVPLTVLINWEALLKP